MAIYGLGARTLPIPGATAALMVIGGIQVAIGAVVLTRLPLFRAVVARHAFPFLICAVGLGVSAMVLGGASADTGFSASAMSWIVLGSIVLRVDRAAVAFAPAVAGVVLSWTAFEDGTAGLRADGDLTTVVLCAMAYVGGSLWIGSSAGVVLGATDRWHVVERQERGLVERLRGGLHAVERAAARVEEELGGAETTPEFNDLRSTLRATRAPGDADGRTDVAELLLDIVGPWTHTNRTLNVDLVVDPMAAKLRIGSVAGDSVAGAVRRQLSNVSRHAAAATRITVSAHSEGNTLVVLVEDDGGGTAPGPNAAGVGTSWSVRQLARVGGTGAYFNGVQGVGYRIEVPHDTSAGAAELIGLSAGREVRHFIDRLLQSIRYVGYVIDTLAAYSAMDQIGERWLLMPLGCVVIEVLVRAPGPCRWSARTGILAAALVAVALVAVFAVPADSPAVLIPASVGANLIAELLWRRSWTSWGVLELVRMVAVAPLVLRHGAESIGFAVVYPLALSLFLGSMPRLATRVESLERSVTDALGRAALTAAALRGIALRHDAVDVITRSGPPAAELREAVVALDAATVSLASHTFGGLDPRAIFLEGLRAGFGIVPVEVIAETGARSAAPAARVGAALDRLSLVELAVLAADERASCAPSRLLRRPRLRSVNVAWTRATDGGVSVEICGEPQLHRPGREQVKRLAAVASAIGVRVESQPDVLRLVLPVT